VEYEVALHLFQHSNRTLAVQQAAVLVGESLEKALGHDGLLSLKQVRCTLCILLAYTIRGKQHVVLCISSSASCEIC
jgi:hypothetical protein